MHSGDCQRWPLPGVSSKLDGKSGEGQGRYQDKKQHCCPLTSSRGARAWMTVGGGGGGGGDGMSWIRESVRSLRLGATACTKLVVAAWAGAGTGSLPASHVKGPQREDQRTTDGVIILSWWEASQSQRIIALAWVKSQAQICLRRDWS